MTIRQDVDALIDWRNANPEPLNPHIHVRCRPDTLRRFAKKKKGGPFMYRGVELIPIKPKKVKPQQLEIET